MEEELHYERIGQWDKAEKDLLASLKVKPNQAYVMNYLSLLLDRKGIKIDKSLKMLKKANKLKDQTILILLTLWAGRYLN